MKTRRRIHGNFDWDAPLIIDPIVFDPHDLTIHTGLLDADGNPIIYEVRAMGPIGFVHFPDPDEDDQ